MPALCETWIPAFAGMSEICVVSSKPSLGLEANFRGKFLSPPERGCRLECPAGPGVEHLGLDVAINLHQRTDPVERVLRVKIDVEGAPIDAELITHAASPCSSKSTSRQLKD